MTRLVALCSVFALLAGCTKARPPATPSGAPPAGEKVDQAKAAETPAGAKPDFEALAARESKGLSEQPVTGPEGRFTGKVPATGPTKVTMDGKIAIVEIPIGAETPIRCQVFDEDVDAGGTISQVLSNATGKVEFERVAPWDAAVVKESPVLFVHALYTVPQPKGKAVGSLKIALHAVPKHPVLCFHDELGYEKTFVASVNALCDSLKHKGPEPEVPSYTEIAIAKLGDAPVGFTRSVRLQHGEDRILTDTTTIVAPVSPSAVRVEDRYTILHVDAEDRITKGLWVTASAGQLDLKVQIDRGKGGKYHYQGVAAGKKIEGDFTTKDTKGLRAAPSVSKEVAKAQGKGVFSVDYVAYRPSEDPTAPIAERLYRDKGDAPDSLRLKAGSMTATATLDGHGLMKTVQMPIGKGTLTMDRAFIRGVPWGS